MFAQNKQNGVRLKISSFFIEFNYKLSKARKKVHFPGWAGSERLNTSFEMPKIRTLKCGSAKIPKARVPNENSLLDEYKGFRISDIFGILALVL